MLRQHGMRRRYYHDELGWNTRWMVQGACCVKLKYSAHDEARRALALDTHCLCKQVWQSRPYPSTRVLPRGCPAHGTCASVCDSRLRRAMRCASFFPRVVWLGDLYLMRSTSKKR